MTFSVEETHDQFRVQIDADELQRALDAYVEELGVQAASALGIGPEEQAELFRVFVSEVLSRMKVKSDRNNWPDQMWRAVVQRTSGRPLGLEEVLVSLNARRIYFWGCEIGHLILQGSLQYQFDPVEHRAVPPEMHTSDDEEDDFKGRGC